MNKTTAILIVSLMAIGIAFGVGFKVGRATVPNPARQAWDEAMRVFENKSDDATARPAPQKKPQPKRTYTTGELSVPGEFTVTRLSYDNSTGRYAVSYVTPNDQPGWPLWPVQINENEFAVDKVKSAIREAIGKEKIRRHNADLLRKSG